MASASECGHRAVLIVTQSVQGTATNVARKRVELCCTLNQGHEGLHADQAAGEQWESKPGEATTTILRHEDAD